MTKAIHQIFIQVYGVKICIKTNNKTVFGELKREIVKLIPVKFEIISPQISDHILYIKSVGKKMYELYKNEENMGRMDKSLVIYTFNDWLRLTIAEFAVSKVFLHAGVVSWKGKAIVIPANSFKGKTTLVAELVKKGALYYSDEYAVLNKDGFVQSFPRKLSLRSPTDKNFRADCSVESLGGRAGNKNIPVGMILLTEFDPKFDANSTAKKWNPKLLSAGQGILEIIPHTISIRYDTKFALKVLNKVASRAIIAKSKRGEAKEFVNLLINFFENNVEYTLKSKLIK
ncbi:MAG: hypothetical protein M3521_10900 [Acidobacteriota bacterium]|nr:hypothetical protein [Acidobacteriota bacterium]